MRRMSCVCEALCAEYEPPQEHNGKAVLMLAEEKKGCFGPFGNFRAFRPFRVPQVLFPLIQNHFCVSLYWTPYVCFFISRHMVVF